MNAELAFRFIMPTPFSCFLFGFGFCQPFLDMPVPVPVMVPQVMPVYLPYLPYTSQLINSNLLKTSDTKKPVVYYKDINKKLPGGYGKGKVFEYHGPGHDEYVHNYGTVQSFGSPESGSFGTSQSSSSGFFKSFSFGSAPSASTGEANTKHVPIHPSTDHSDASKMTTTRSSYDSGSDGNEETLNEPLTAEPRLKTEEE
ncbi:hypothetical protein V3C99_014367, partial [Haemonchus contortus]